MHTMVAQDLRKAGQTHHFFIAAMFNASPKPNPILLLKFYKLQGNSMWDPKHQEQQCQNPSKKKELLQNCFIIQDNQESTIFIIMKYCLLFFSQDMEPIKSVDIDKVLNSGLEHLNCFVRDFSAGFLLSAVLCPDQAQYGKYTNQYVGSTRTDINVAIIRCSYTAKDAGALLCTSVPKNSCLFRNEQVRSIFEYAPNNLIAHISPTDLVILVNWQVMQLIQDPQSGNHNKVWFQSLPGFDSVLFPFLVVSGRESFNLINLKDGRMQKLILAPCKNHGP